MEFLRGFKEKGLRSSQVVELMNLLNHLLSVGFKEKINRIFVFKVLMVCQYLIPRCLNQVRYPQETRRG